MRRALLAAALVVAGCASGPAQPSPVEDARRLDEEALATHAAAIDGPEHARHWVVVQKGDVAAAAALPDDAIRTAAAKDAAPAHRFVFRPADRGLVVYRLAFLAEGGVVAGRRFLADLGLEAVGPAGRPASIRKKGSSVAVDLGAARRLAIDVSLLDGSERRTIDAVFDPDFDGGLIVTRELAASLALERFEIPGGADVIVALARPFRAHRATVNARIASLVASGPVEVVYETAPRRR